MRLGIDASNLRSGGAITHVAELLRHAEPESHGIHRVRLWASSATLDRVVERPWLERVHVSQLEGPLLHRIAWQVLVRPGLARSWCDVLFAPGATPPGSFRPYVSMSANMLPFNARERSRYRWSMGWLRMVLLRYQQAHAFRRSNAVIFLTDFARNAIGSLVDSGIASRASVIPSGVSDQFRCEPRLSRPLSSYTVEHPFRFVYVSDIHPYKHHWNVAEAVMRLRREGLPIAVDFVGSLAHYPSVKRLQRALSNYAAALDGIRIIGPVAHDRLPGIYREADAFLFASTCENLPITLLEAMASGLPVAASDTRPMPDILGDAAVYFQAESISSIEAALRRLAMDCELRQVGAMRLYTESWKYSWTHCADRTFALLAEVAGNEASAGSRVRKLHRMTTADQRPL